MKVGRCECQKLPESSDISTAARQVDGEAPTPKLSPHPLVQDSPLGWATPPPSPVHVSIRAALSVVVWRSRPGSVCCFLQKCPQWDPCLGERGKRGENARPSCRDQHLLPVAWLPGRLSGPPGWLCVCHEEALVAKPHTTLLRFAERLLRLRPPADVRRAALRPFVTLSRQQPARPGIRESPLLTRPRLWVWSLAPECSEPSVLTDVCHWI